MCTVTLVVMIGLPGAGKTTFCSEVCKVCMYNEKLKVHSIDYDSLIGKSYTYNYRNSRKKIFDSVTHLVDTLHNSKLYVSHIILIDDNMYYRSMRYKYFQLAQSYNALYIQIYFDVDLSTAIIQNNQREWTKRVPHEVIEKMANKIAPPLVHKGWEENVITLITKGVCTEATITHLLDVIITHVPKCCVRLEIKTGTLPKSRLQDIEIALRKVVKSKITEDVSKQKNYVVRKKDIFDQIKQGKIEICKTWDEEHIYTYLTQIFDKEIGI